MDSDLAASISAAAVKFNFRPQRHTGIGHGLQPNNEYLALSSVSRRPSASFGHLSGATSMNNPQVVYDFLRSRAGHAFCDDCIKAHTGVHASEASTIARTLALFPGEFVRQTGECSEKCSLRRKEVTMAKPKSIF